ncbi:MAG TPA: LytTR family DNA-binding domain-containing protein [Pedomonas sp.]|uniref:LytTR family DNA-binding domain-containing protein n=1 Tax=Pedomonas sp. TaxID=2976421 RepID=UPI002F3EBC3C
MRARLDTRQILTEGALMLLLAVMLAATGPFGTFLHGSGPVRLVYWLRTVLAGYLLFRPGILLFACAARRLGFPEAAGWTTAVVLLSAPMALYLWCFGPHIMPDRPWPGIEDFMDTYAQVLLTSGLAMALLWWRNAPGAEAKPAPESTPQSGLPETAPAQPGPRIGALLAERLPPHLGQDVIALQMEDHYVRVHTMRGDTLVLMRMADAVAELEGLDGLRVHRSWWAARAAVTAVERNGRSATLMLSNGLEVPVARDRLPQLRVSGWLD